ncbi:MAG: hypothetical protein JWO96_193 [Candidatus Saccharibacteria bacterium]|nr:hypothetical protein [Candidatus Saccharibacteria bacterium]
MTNYVHPVQSPEDIAGLFLQAMEVRDDLLAGGVDPDGPLEVEYSFERREGLLRRRRTVKGTLSLCVWVLPSDPDHTLDDVILGVDGQLYLYYPSRWPGEGSAINTESPAIVLSEWHLEKWVTVGEVEEGLSRLVARHS